MRPFVEPNSDLPQRRHFGRYQVQSRRGMTTPAMRARQHMSARYKRRLIGFQQQQLVIGFERHHIDERSRGRPSHRGGFQVLQNTLQNADRPS